MMTNKYNLILGFLISFILNSFLILSQVVNPETAEPYTVADDITSTLVHPTPLSDCSDGSIELEINGGYDPITFYWSNGATSQNLENVGPGTYTVEIIDAICGNAELVFELDCECFSDCTITGDVTEANCNQGGEIKIEIECVENGHFPFTYQWEDGPNWKDRTDLNIGIYCLTATDVLGCEHIKCFEIIGDGILQIDIVDKQNVFECTDVFNGSACDGAIDLEVSGSSNGITYEWSNGASTQDLSNLCSGDYSVTITDALGCQKTLSASICCCTELIEWSGGDSYEVPGNCYQDIPGGYSPISIEGEVNLDIQNPTISTTITGGTEDYILHWTGPNGYSEYNVSSISGIFTEGEYCLSVDDGCSIQATECFQILFCENMELLTFDAIQPCPGKNTGSIVVTIPDGFNISSIEWSNGSNGLNVSNLSFGDYCVTITTTNCEISGCISLSEETEFEVSHTSFITQSNFFNGEENFTFQNLTCVTNYFCQGEIIESESVAAPMNIGFQGASCFGSQVCEDGSFSQTGTITLPLNPATQGTIWEFAFNGSTCELLFDCPIDNAGMQSSEIISPVCNGFEDIGGGMCSFDIRCCKKVWVLWPIIWNRLCESFTSVQPCGTFCGSNIVGEDPMSVANYIDEKNNRQILVTGKTTPNNDVFIKSFDKDLYLQRELILEGDNSLFVKSVSLTDSPMFYGYVSDSNDGIFTAVSNYETNGRDGVVMVYDSEYFGDLRYFGGKGDQEVVDILYTEAQDLVVLGYYQEELVLNNTILTENLLNDKEFFLVNLRNEDVVWQIYSDGRASASGLLKVGNSIIVSGTFENELRLNNSLYASKPGTHQFLACISEEGEILWIKTFEANNVRLTSEYNNLHVYCESDVETPLVIDGITYASESQSQLSLIHLNTQNGSLLEVKILMQSDGEVQISGVENSNSRYLLTGTIKGNYSTFNSNSQFSGISSNNSNDIWIYDSSNEEFAVLGNEYKDVGRALTVLNDEIIFTGHYYSELTINDDSFLGHEEYPNFFISKFSTNKSNFSDLEMRNSQISRSENILKVELLPNPTSDILNIAIMGDIKGLSCDFEILSTEGILLDRKLFNPTSNRMSLMENFKDYTQGIYFIKFNLGEQIIFRKVVVN